jgi:anaerobic magnesium-protoporphyrin IX monomethyl ester cyclase
MYKKVALINPSSKNFLSNAGDRMPLGILYISSYLENRGIKTAVFDLDHDNSYNVLNAIRLNNYDAVGISAYNSVLEPDVIKLCQDIRLVSGSKLVLGGYHATAMPDKMLKYSDAVVIGEGEDAMYRIVKNNLSGIVNGIRLIPEDIPIPNRLRLAHHNYNMQQDGVKTGTLMSSRGCPYSCHFCGNWNKNMRFFDVNHVRNEIKQLQLLGYNSLYFLDDTFTINKKRALSLIDMIGSFDIPYRITTRVNHIDKDIVNRLKNNNCSWVSIGIESGSNESLKEINKQITTEQVYNAVSMLGDAGIKVKGFFMFGLPRETESRALETIFFASKLKKVGLTSADFYIMTPFPNTEIYNDPVRFGINIEDKDYTKYLEASKDGFKAFHNNGILSRKEIEFYRNLAEIKFNQND